MDKKVVKIEDWAIVGSAGSDPYMAPELEVFCLFGVVIDHSREDLNGKFVRTSAIVDSDGEYIVTRSGSRYDLGSPSEEYEKLFPNAKERLFARIQEFNTSKEE